MTKRIAFDARLIGAFGIGRYISGLVPALASILGDRLTVFTQGKDAALVRALVGPSSRLSVVKAPPYRLAEQSTLPLKVLTAGVDLVHFPHYNLPLLYPGTFVVTVHDLFPFQFPEIHSGPLPRAVNRLLIRNAVGRAKAIITPSAATAGDVQTMFRQATGKVFTIPEAADERFGPSRDPEAEAAWQARLGIRPPYVLYLGQWKAYKNLPVLLEAFVEVAAQYPSAQLVLTGNDPRHPEIRRMASRLSNGSIIFPGKIPDSAIPDVYRGAAVVVMPSRAEGFGLPVIEAMACGVPVVCSDLPVLREIADGAAIFCNPDDPGAFARGILQSLQSPPSAQLRERAVARAARFSWKRTAEETVRVYERVLENLVRPALEKDSRRREQDDLQVKP